MLILSEADRRQGPPGGRNCRTAKASRRARPQRTWAKRKQKAAVSARLTRTPDSWPCHRFEQAPQTYAHRHRTENHV